MSRVRCTYCTPYVVRRSTERYATCTRGQLPIVTWPGWLAPAQSHRHCVLRTPYICTGRGFFSLHWGSSWASSPHPASCGVVRCRTLTRHHDVRRQRANLSLSSLLGVVGGLPFLLPATHQRLCVCVWWARRRLPGGPPPPLRPIHFFHRAGLGWAGASPPHSI